MPLFAAGNPVQASGQVNLVAGADYKAVDGQAAVFTNKAGTWVDLTGATVWFVGFIGNFPLSNLQTPVAGVAIPPQWFPPPLIAPVQGSVVTPSGANQQVSFDLPATVTGVRPCGSPNDLFAYAVYAALANGDIVPLQTGPLFVQGVGS